MGESFDLTFFLHKEQARREQAKKVILEILNIDEGKMNIEQHNYPLFSNKEVLFYDMEGNDFVQYFICLSDVVFTKKSFDVKVEQLLRVVETCFNNIDSILFATGIYELTCYNIEGINDLIDFNINTFNKFPFLFFKEGNEYGLGSKQQYKNVSYIINSGKNVQDIFANPITELMEDYDMSFEEAKRKAEY